MYEDGLALFYPDGQPFKNFEELAAELKQTQLGKEQMQEELEQAQLREQQAQAERDAAFAKLQELGIDPRTI